MRALAIGDILSVKLDGDLPVVGKLVQQYPTHILKIANETIPIYPNYDIVTILSDEKAMLWKLENE